VAWRLADRPEASREQHKALVARRHPKMADRDLKLITVRALYLDAQGNACGSDSLRIDLTRDRDVVVLPSLGKEGSPARVVLTLESFTLAERETVVPAQ
jgi:hypothetical protein